MTNPRRPHRSRPTGLPGAMALEARQLLATLVAIVDTGVDLASTADAPYYDLAQGYDAYRQRSVAQFGPSVVQDNGHSPDGAPGHWHGSTIADEVVRAIRDAQSQPGAGGANVQILPVRATNDQGEYDTAALIRGIHYAADRGAAAIDLSFRASSDFAAGGTGERLSQAIAYAASKGSVVSVAAANDHANIDDPSRPATIYPLAIRAPNMLVSAAVDANGLLSPISNWGSKSVDLGAPAVAGATSYAAGYTAGLVGVVAALDPALSATDRVGLLKATALPAAQDVGAWSTTGGVANPAGAVARALTLAANGVAAPTRLPLLIAAGQLGTGTYVGDGAYTSGGNTYPVANAIDTSGVVDPAPASVYQNERWTNGTMTDTIPRLTPGATYTIRLDFSENFYGGANQRLFNVSINGSPVLANFDIFKAAGAMNKAASRSFAATADGNGQLAIRFTNVTGGAKVDAIRVVAGVAPGVVAAVSTPTAVNLSGAYNVVGITSDANPGVGNLDGNRYSYSGSTIPTNLTSGGVTFALGAAGTTNAVRSGGQTVALAAGSYSSLRLLGTGVNGRQAGAITVNYADGTSTTVQQGFSDWYAPSGATGEAVALVASNRNWYSGRDLYYRNFALYQYAIPLNSAKAVRSVTLPNNQNIAILAATLVP